MTVVDDGVDEDEHRTEILFMFSAAEIYYNYRNIAFVVVLLFPNQKFLVISCSR